MAENNPADTENSNSPNILEVPVDSFGTAMALLYEFLNIANRRGAFRIEESAKALSCISFMQRALTAPPPSQEKAEEKQKQPAAKENDKTTSVQPKKKA